MIQKYEEKILHSSIAKFSGISIEYDNKEKTITYIVNKKYSNELDNSHKQKYVFANNKLKTYNENACVSRNQRKNNPGITINF